MIQIFADGKLVLDSRLEEYAPQALRVTAVLSKGGTAEITLPRTHPSNGLFQPYKTVVEIYRHQELYSDAVAALAMTEGLPLIDVRRQFLPMRDLPRYIAADGIHLTMTGYRCLFDTLAGWIRERL